MINLYSLVLLAYITLRLIVPLPIGIAAKTGAAVFVLLVSLKHFFFQHFFGGLASPDLPRYAIIIAGWLYVTLTFLFVLLVFRDILFCLLWIGNRAGLSISLPVMGLSASLAIVALSFACSTYALYEAVRHPDLITTEVVLKRLPKALDGLTIVQITDLHASGFLPGEKVRRIVETVNGLHPDLILLTGDIVDGTTAKREKDVAPLKDLRAKYGVFGSVGNHEYYSGFDAWQEKFAELGIRMLNNRHVTLSINGAPLVLAGITDPVAAQFGKAVPNVSEAFQDAPDTAVRVLMAHRPQDAEVHANAGADLQLSGHTHGGQIIGLNQIAARFNQGFLAGRYDIGSMKLYVSTGISLWNGFPARFGVPSEMTVVILRAEQ